MTLGSCAAQQSAFDPASCQSAVTQGGSTTAYTKCLLAGARDKTVSGMPVLSDSARLGLQNEEEDPCRKMEQSTTADLLACEMSRPLRPAPTIGPRVGVSDAPPLPLIVAPTK